MKKALYLSALALALGVANIDMTYGTTAVATSAVETLVRSDIARSLVLETSNEVREKVVESLSNGKIQFQKMKLNLKDVKLIARVLELNLGIQELDFYGNNINDDTVTVLAEALKVNKTLKKLTLFNNSISDKGATAIAEALKVNKTLEELILFANSIGDDGATAIAEALKVNNTLTKLNLRRNKISPKGETALAEAKPVDSKLRSLLLDHDPAPSATKILKDHGIDQTIIAAASEEVREEVAKCFSTKEGITLDLSWKILELDDVKLVAEALKKNPNVEKLDLTNDFINDEGIIEIIEALKVNYKLAELYLGSNRIGTKSANAIANAIANTLKNIKILDLHSSLIGGEEDVISIVNAAKNSQLTDLYLYKISIIGDKSAMAIADMVKTSKTLRYIYCDTNRMTEVGRKAISDAMEKNKAVKWMLRPKEDHISQDNNNDEMTDAGSTSIDPIAQHNVFSDAQNNNAMTQKEAVKRGRYDYDDDYNEVIEQRRYDNYENMEDDAGSTPIDPIAQNNVFKRMEDDADSTLIDPIAQKNVFIDATVDENAQNGNEEMERGKYGDEGITRKRQRSI